MRPQVSRLCRARPDNAGRGTFAILYSNSDSTDLHGPFLAYYLRNMYLHHGLRVPGTL